MIDEVQRIVDSLLESHSESEIKRALSASRKRKGARSLTVIVNFGMHALPEDILRGDVFFFSEGNVDLSAENVQSTMTGLSKRALKYLRSKIWENIYIVPSGHPALVVLATLVVYRVTRINPTVVYYLDGKYNDVKFDVRSEVIKGNTLS